MTRCEKDGVVWFSGGGFGSGAVHGFSTRFGGVSAGPFASLNLSQSRGDDPDRVTENIRRFLRALGAGERLLLPSQVHGGDVWTVTEAPPAAGPICFGPAADGVVTALPRVAIGVLVADCTPVLLFDPVRGAIGAAHAGWRGTAADAAGKTVAAMCDGLGCRPRDLRAAVGPCIGPCCFETDGDVPAAMQAAMGQAAMPFCTRDGEKWRVDLKGINALLLRRAGVLPDHIDVSPLCTGCDAETFWSHRRMGETRGSQAAVIALQAPP